MDLLGDLNNAPIGSRCLLDMVDLYTKLVRTVPLKSISSLNMEQAFEHWIYTYGIPKTGQTDNGSQFSSKLMPETYIILGVECLFTNTYHLHTNGQFHRFNQALLQAVRKHVFDDPIDWDLRTSSITFAYNTQSLLTT